MPPCKILNADAVPAINYTSTPIREIRYSTVMHNERELGQRLDKTLQTLTGGNSGTIDSSSSTTEFSSASATSSFKPPFDCKAEISYVEDVANKANDQIANIKLYEAQVAESCENASEVIRPKSITDHVYEEVTALNENPIEYDIFDYYEKYSPTTAKTLVNTLFLPRHKICKQCASLKQSPVYTDTLIYAKQPLLAKEVQVYYQDNVLQFKYSADNAKPPGMLFLQYDSEQQYMLVHNYTKTNASSIFYFRGPPRDSFDLNATLKPSILLLNSVPKQPMNTHLYHRNVNNFYIRVSNRGYVPMNFRTNYSNLLSSIKRVGYDTDLQNWMNYRGDLIKTRSLKESDVVEYRPNRSSLLLLEPLLLMPDLTSSRQRNDKNHISDPEHVKVIKIVIAYTLSFFVLATITFYIVYFT